MKRSNFFLPTLKENPQGASLPSHRLMLRSGMIYQTTSGIYSWLPLGFKVLRNIEKIIEEEQDKIGCQRIIMPLVQPSDLWKETNRYDVYGKEMLRMHDRHEKDMLFCPTSEEVTTDIMRHFVHSYKQLPTTLYQIHWKFRDEIRPRFGVMRGREFLMKDGYSFDLTIEDAKKTYENIFNSYIKIFDRIFQGIPDPKDPSKNIKAIPVKADTGPIGGDLSHEFQILADNGESELYFDKRHYDVQERNFNTLKNLYAAADEKHDPLACPKENLRSARGIEIGHIFYFGDKYSKAMNFSIPGPDGKAITPFGGSYGIGVSRLVASIIETSYDENGIIWPISVAPYKIGIVNLLKDLAPSSEIYEMLLSQNIETILDDRLDVTTGVKFAEMDLIGIPFQIIVGKNYKEMGMVEIKTRRTKEIKQIKKDHILNVAKWLI